MNARPLCGAIACLLSVLGTPCLAQANAAANLQQRQALMRQLTQQQQAQLEQRSRCINQASTLQELERCERGHPSGAMGGWRCPMW